MIVQNPESIMLTEKLMSFPWSWRTKGQNNGDKVGRVIKSKIWELLKTKYWYKCNTLYMRMFKCVTVVTEEWWTVIRKTRGRANLETQSEELVFYLLNSLSFYIDLNTFQS